MSESQTCLICSVVYSLQLQEAHDGSEQRLVPKPSWPVHLGWCSAIPNADLLLSSVTLYMILLRECELYSLCVPCL